MAATITVSVVYGIDGMMGVDESVDDSIQELAESYNFTWDGSGSGFGLRDIDLSTDDTSIAALASAVLLSREIWELICDKEEPCVNPYVIDTEETADEWPNRDIEWEVN